jgi:uncharacterized phage protein (TIGR02220 family)
MAKRLIDTELWNNEDIIEYFTAEDKYFWLYLLTNPHNNICGVMKASPVLIARDMGYSKDCVQNLMYRFENVHKAIFVDHETHELLILNWGKFNWNKSPDILRTVEKNLASINSEKIKTILDRKISEIWEFEHPVNTLSTPCQQGTITNTITNTIKDIVDYLNTKLNTKYRYETQSTQKHIKARLNEGFVYDDFVKVIDNMYDAWHNDDKMSQYLRPETLFGTKFQSYLNKKGANNAPQHSLTTEKDKSDLDEIFGKVMANGRKGNS